MARRQLTLRDRLQIGLTLYAALAAARVVKERVGDDQWSGMSHSEIAASIAAEMYPPEHEIWNNPRIDWEALIAFLEALVPLILLIIEKLS